EEEEEKGSEFFVSSLRYRVPHCFPNRSLFPSLLPALALRSPLAEALDGVEVSRWPRRFADLRR
ncbi:unnamed protein product, partial [Musa textilis]